MIFAKRCFAMCAAVVLATWMAAPASATVIYSEDFEGVNLNGDANTHTLPTGWTTTASGDTYTINPAAASAGFSAYQGSQCLLMNMSMNGSVTSGTAITATTVVGDTYTLTAVYRDYGSNSQNTSNANWQMDILDNGVSVALVTLSHHDQAGFFEATTSYTATASGHSLAVKFSQSPIDNTLWYTGQSWIDAVQLDQTAASTPEPGTLAMVLAAGVGLLAYAWRKRR
jgi:hypothetical protein